MNAHQLDRQAIDIEMLKIPLWTLYHNPMCISRTFIMQDFTKALAFMGEVAVPINELDHHPEWTNVYNKVEVKLFTHSANGLTELDFVLATLMDQIYKDFQS
jgi:4a-hydroxytetrahydrobiopterin dehydratase